MEQGRKVLEACGFNDDFSSPDRLPEPLDVDAEHRRWRSAIVQAAKREGLEFRHGVAAKLIDIYLKSRFVCGGHHADARVQSLHPPIDDVLLKTLAQEDVGGHAKQWRQARMARWSRLTSAEYQHLIRLIRESLNGEPLWNIEEYWQGNQ